MTTNAQSSRLWLIGGAAVALLIVVASWLVVISPVRADTETLRTNTESVEMQNSVLVAKLTALKEQDARRDELVAALRASLAGLPADPALPDFNRQVVRQAAAHEVVLVNITVGNPSNPVQDPAAPVDPSAPASGLLAVPITIQSKGTVLDQLYFLKDLQQLGPRHALVTSTALTAETTEGESANTDRFTMTTQLTVFSSTLSPADREQLAEVLGDGLNG